jgi:hypothetical protein
MSLRGVILRPDGAPLGTVEEVQFHLANAFPGTTFTHEESESPGSAEIQKKMSLFLRLWLLVFGVDGQYPRYIGLWQGSRTAVQFYMPAADPVRKISATSYGSTGGLDANFDRLMEATGWEVKYPRF